MKELRNKAGDLAMVVRAETPLVKKHIGHTVTCVEYFTITGMWIVNDREGNRLKYTFFDDELLPLGGEHILTEEPKPELKLGDDAEQEKEEAV